MLPVKVTCAIIEKDGRILLAQRGDDMDLPGKWEFPGGKVRKTESPSACLTREIREELGLDITIKEVLPPHRHSYNHISIEVLPHICSMVSGSITLHEHKDVRWADPGRASEFDLAEADIPVLETYLSREVVIIWPPGCRGYGKRNLWKNLRFEYALWTNKRDPLVFILKALRENCAWQDVAVHFHLLRQPVECFQANPFVEGVRVH